MALIILDIKQSIKNRRSFDKHRLHIKEKYKDLHIFFSCLLPRDDEKSVKRSLVYAVNCYLKKLCTDQFHYLDLDAGWTLNNHLNTELFRSDNLHLNRKGYEKLSTQLAHDVVATLGFGCILVATSDNVVTTFSQRCVSDVVTTTKN